MTCHKGGYLNIRNNKIRDVSSSLLAEVCHNTCVETVLQPLNGESFQSGSANTQYEARCDIRACGFWSRGQDAFFDVMFFFTQMHPPIATKTSPPCTSCTGMQRRESMEKEYGSLNTLCLLHWSCQPVVACRLRQQRSTRSSPQVLLPSGSSSTARC